MVRGYITITCVVIILVLGLWSNLYPVTKTVFADGGAPALEISASGPDDNPAQTGTAYWKTIQPHMGFVFEVLVFVCLIVLFQWNRLLKKERASLNETKEALRRSEELFKRTFVQAPLGAAIIDGQGNFVKVNKKLVEMMGFSEEEFLARTIFDVTHPDDVSKIREKNRAMRSGDIEYCYFTTRSIHKDNRVVWTHISVRPIFDAHGRPVFFLPMVEDITEKKQTEDELLKLSRAVEQSPASVVMTDPEGAIEYVNPKFTDITGYSQDEALGQNPRILSSGLQSKDFYKDMWDTILNGKTWQGEFANKKKNGDLYWELASISPVRNLQGELTHFVAVKEDITERKKTDEALKKQLDELNRTKQSMMTVMEDLERAKAKAEAATDAKGAFLANMSHEIRTPMNAIVGMSHLALKTELTDKQRDYLTKIQVSSHALLSIINDILDFSKIEAGKLHMEETDFDLEDILKNVASLVNVKAGQKNLELLMDIKPMLPTRLIGDPLRLTQVLTNLADNAIKFTRQGEIVIRADIQERTDKHITLEFSVQDTGIGMTADQKTMLFRPFTQADTSTTRTFGGTGLGLSISKHLVEMMGGSIGVASVPDEGSTFYFTARFGLQQEQASKRFMLNGHLKHKRVLVVDDNALARNIMEDHLRPFGLEVEQAESGQDALDRMKSWQPDMVFMDYKMPGMDGLECVKRMFELNPTPVKPKVIMVTAYGDDEIQDRARQLDLDGFLVKPVSPSLLFDSVVNAFGSTVQPASALIPKLKAGPEARQGIENKHVLLVEDNDINTQLAIELLEEAGVDVSVAVNGREAVDMVSRQRFDAVLMDVQMPVMDGLAATKKIREMGYGKEDLPIIAMTAHAMAGDREKSLDAGMNDHITKPVDPDQLYRVLSGWMGGIDVKEKKAGTVDAFPEKEYSGLSLDKGLKHSAGNPALYKHLMEMFSRDYSGASARMDDALTRRDSETAQRLAHTLKSVAGNIGAVQLYTASSTLEKTLKKDEPESLQGVLNRFHQSLSEALDSVNRFMEDTKVTAENGKISEYSETRALLPVLKQLVSVIRSRNPRKCLDVIRDIEPFLNQEPYSRDLGMICDSVKRYRYTDAEPVLESLINVMEGG